MEEASASSSSEVRLVRCPKCGNLPTELPDFSVYLCGGCGAVLRAKRKELVEDGLSEISDDENGRVVFNKGGIATSLYNVFETNERENSGFDANRTLDLHNCSTSRSENEDVLVDSIGSGKGEPISIHTRFDQPMRDRLNDECGSSKDGLDDWACANDVQKDMGGHKYVDSNVGNKFKEILHCVGSLSSRTVIEKWDGERNVSLGSHGNAMDATRRKRGMNFAPLKGPPEYGMGSSYGTGDYRRHYDDFNGFARVADLGNDRAELLRKIDELKDQLSRTFDVAENPKERFTLEPRMASTPFDPYSSHDAHRQGLFGANKQALGQGHHVLGPPYNYEDGGNVPYKGRHGSIMQDFYPAYQPFRYFPQMHHNEYPDPYMDVNSHPLRLHPHESPFHQPACSCSQCFDQNWKVPPVIPPPSFGNQRSHDPANTMLYQHKISAARGYTSEDFIPNLQFRNQRWLTRSSSGHAQAEFDFGHQNPPRKVIIAHGSRQVCRAISGGAPFITCCNCFELLKLPWKRRMMGKNQNKMRCGACSSIMLYELSGKGIILSVPKQIAKLSAEIADGLGDMPNTSFESSHGCTNPCSNYDDHNYEFANTKVEPFPGNQKSNSDESQKRQDAHSLSSSFSEKEKSEGVVVGKDDSLSVELPSKDDLSLPLSDSPLHHNCISSDDAADSYKVTKWSSEKEGQQHSVKDASMATEMDISMNESVNSGASQEFFEVSKDDSRLNDQKGSESFVGLIKRSFGELSGSSQSSEDRRSNVFVNGQLIPVCEVKRAEKLAGPIQLGEYWYDVRAGFWGVMGHPCLGIIPPNIEEFNYPMPKNCAAGNTGVFVNGRELQQKDLDLLVRRGLPTTKNKSYLIEISGKVVDEQTGEELDGLGKLAPTVERVKHGFGMKIPKLIAEQSY